MKTTKKILSLLLVAAMIFTLAVPVLAEETAPETLVSWTGGNSVTSNGANDVVKDVALTMNDSNPDYSPNLNQYSSLGITTSTYGNLQVQPWYGTNNFSEANFGYMQFVVSTAGYENLSLSMKAGNNGKAPASYSVSVSADNGATWVAAADKLSAPDTKVNKEDSALVSSVALPEAAEDQPSVIVRIQQAAAAINANNAGNLYVYALALTGTETSSVILHTPDVVLENAGLWGEDWANAYTMGWKYVDFDFSSLTGITCGMLDKDGVLLVEYTADEEQLTWQLENGCVNENGQSSVSFYQADENGMIAMVRDYDWTVQTGPAFKAWQPATFYLTVETVDKTYELSSAYEGPFAEPTDVVGDYDGQIVILHSNDVHGSIAGYANMAGLKTRLENLGATVIMADAGDFSQGTCYVSTTKGMDAITMMNAAGYDVATLGNHEFDYGWFQLKSNLDKANFQVVCADVFDSEGKTLFPANTIIERDGVKIGFFGMETPEAQTKVNPALIKGLDFLAEEEMFACAQQQVYDLKAQGADIIICLSHLGIDDESVGNRSIDMLAKVEGIDLLIDGHSHSVLSEGPNGEVMQSTGTAFANIGCITIDIASKSIEENFLVPVDAVYTPADKTVAAAAQKIIDRVDAEYGQVFAKSEVALNGDKAPGNRTEETNLGDLISDALLWTVTKEEGAIRDDVAGIVALTNGGGIRAWINAGDISKKDVNTVLPFGNTVAVVYVTGAELLEALEASCYMAPDAVGGFPQVAGLKFNIDTTKEFDAGDLYPGSTYHGPASIQRVSIDSVSGQSFDPEAVYAVVTNNFCAAGGDTYYAFAAATEQFDTGIPMDEALMAYITEVLGGVIGQQYAKPQGRITIGAPVVYPMEGKTVILHSNDVHGAIAGYANMAALKADFEAQGAQVILADAGDYSQGTCYVSTTKGMDAITMMNAAGYDIATLGNHEFDYGWFQLKSNLDKANFQVVCADVFDAQGKTLFPANTIIVKDGVKIGFFGMETPEAQTKVNPALIKGLDFLAEEAMFECAQVQVNELKAAGADIIICLGHLGIDDESIGNRSIDLLAKVEGIDLFIDGHSHSVLTVGPNGEKMQSTGTAFANIGVVVIDNETKAIEDNYLVAITEESAKDEAVAAAAQAIIDRVDAEYGQIFAKSEVELNGDKAPGNRTEETNLGDLITDSLLWTVTKEEGAIRSDVAGIVALTNGGGIRAWIHAGDISKKDVNTVLPFGNTVAVVYVTGAELLEALEASCYMAPDAVGGFPQVAGMQFNIDTTTPFDEGELYPGSTYHGPASIQRVSIDNINGKDFDPEAVYAVVTNNFCAAGGDTYYAFAAATEQFDTGIPMDEALMAYITEELGGVIGEQYAAPQGRITNHPALYGKTVILHSNDVHGAITGYANMAALKAEYEEMGATVILADAGDFSQGSAYVSTTKGMEAVNMMNVTGYDVVTLGNHEFDYGWAQLSENLSKAEFQVICADVFGADGKTLFPANTIIEKNGVKIGFFGMETPEAQTKVNPALIKGLNFLAGEEMFACAQAQVNELKAAGADIIICLGHLGIDDESIGNRSIDLLAKVEGIDLFIDGHSHSVLCEGPNGEKMQSTGTAFANIGVVIIDNETKQIESNFLAELSEDAAVDETVAAAAQAIIDRVDAEYGQVFAKSEVELNGDKAPGNRTEETNLGDLITDALLWTVLREDGAIRPGVGGVVALTNGGGIRAWIHAGDVTKKDVNTVLPFGNTVAVVYVTGAELLEALEASCYMAPDAVGGFPQVAGMEFNIATCMAFDEGALYPDSTYHGPASIQRVSIKSINGEAFDPEAVYAVVTNNFCAAGGDTYYAFAAATEQFDTGIPMDEALMAYITEELGGVIGEQYAAPQGRITIGHDWEEIVIPCCVTNKDLFGDEEGKLQVGTFKVCRCGEEEFVAVEPNAKDHSQHAFRDIDNSVYHDYIIAGSMMGLVSGKSATSYDPQGAVTRAQFISMMWRMAGRPAGDVSTLTFADAASIPSYAKEAVAWGVENGIIYGFAGNVFAPNQTINRGQMAAFLYRYMKLMLGEEILAEITEDCGFTDVPGTTFENAINCIASLGIVSGYGNNTFRAQNTCNRGMAARVFVNTSLIMIAIEQIFAEQAA